jgi:hypothetical protein
VHLVKLIYAHTCSLVHILDFFPQTFPLTYSIVFAQPLDVNLSIQQKKNNPVNSRRMIIYSMVVCLCNIFTFDWSL